MNVAHHMRKPWPARTAVPWTLLAAGAIVLLIAWSSLAYAQDRSGGVERIKTIGFTVGDIERAANFFANVLQFEKLADFRVVGSEYDALDYDFEYDEMHYRVKYEPGESDSGMFGGNSNWRGPIWMPVNYLLIENLRRFHLYYGDGLKIECPTGSGVMLTLSEIADEFCRRVLKVFLRGPDGRRPVFGNYEKFQTDPHFKDYILFHEYFHGDNGRGCGASHQTGWTGLIANLISQLAEEQPGARVKRTEPVPAEPVHA